MSLRPAPVRRALLGASLCSLAVVGLLGPAAGTAGAVDPVRPDLQRPVGGAALGARGLVLPPAPPTLPALPALPALTAASWVVADLDSGEVLGARDPHGRYAPASTLKTLTALTLIPLLDPRDRVVPRFEEVNVEGSKVGLVDRVAYPVPELFHALLMVSGNDAANALAGAAGGLPTAVGLMNAEAVRLGALDTRAVNPSGLDATGQLSSAYDLALVAREAMTIPVFRRYVARRVSSVSGPGGKRIEIYNKNRLLRSYDGALGIKNGYTVKARASVVAAATRGGRTLVVTIMRAEPRIWEEAAALLDWGFAAARASTPPVGTLVAPLTVQEPTGITEAVAVPASRTTDDGPGALQTVGLGTGALLLGGLLGRRAQIKRRRRRRLASRRVHLDLPL